MTPTPLVAFSMRVPSRVVDSIRAPDAKFSINLLAAHQGFIAERFARADLYPEPWKSEGVLYELDERGIPVLRESVGWLECRTKSVTQFGETRGSSLLIIGEVDELRAGDADRQPLVYYQRAYTSLTEPEQPASPFSTKSCAFALREDEYNWLMPAFRDGTPPIPWHITTNYLHCAVQGHEQSDCGPYHELLLLRTTW